MTPEEKEELTENIKTVIRSCRRVPTESNQDAEIKWLIDSIDRQFCLTGIKK